MASVSEQLASRINFGSITKAEDLKKRIKNGILLPHPRMHKRNFVLFPLFEIEKDWKHPILKDNIKNLIFSLSKDDIRSIKKI